MSRILVMVVHWAVTQFVVKLLENAALVRILS